VCEDPTDTSTTWQWANYESLVRTKSTHIDLWFYLLQFIHYKNGGWVGALDSFSQKNKVLQRRYLVPTTEKTFQRCIEEQDQFIKIYFFTTRTPHYIPNWSRTARERHHALFILTCEWFFAGVCKKAWVGLGKQRFFFLEYNMFQIKAQKVVNEECEKNRLKGIPMASGTEYTVFHTPKLAKHISVCS